jgi:hypothetical protein
VDPERRLEGWRIAALRRYLEEHPGANDRREALLSLSRNWAAFGAYDPVLAPRSGVRCARRRGGGAGDGPRAGRPPPRCASFVRWRATGASSTTTRRCRPSSTRRTRPGRGDGAAALRRAGRGES